MALFPLALCCFAICLINDFLLRVILLLAALPFLYKRYCGKQRMIALVVMAVLLVCSIPLNDRAFETGRVVAIRNNYIVVQSGLRKAIIYDNDSDVTLDDVIEINGEAEVVQCLNNFEISTFADYCKAENIVGSFSMDGIHVVKESRTLRGWLYRTNKERGNEWILALLFKDGEQSDSNFSYLIKECSFQIAFLYHGINALLQLLIEKEKSKKIALAVFGAIGLLFHFPFGYQRIIISQLICLSIRNPRQQTALDIITLCLLKPYGIFSLSLLIPIGLRLLSLFCDDEEPLLVRLVIIFIQLCFNGSCSLMISLLYPMVSTLTSLAYLAALVMAFIPIGFNPALIDELPLWLDQLPDITLTASPSLLMILLFILLLNRYCISRRRIVKVALCLWMLINHYSGFLNPFPTLCQLDIGQGDCCIIQLPFSDNAVLIDCCGSFYRDNAKRIIIPYLRRNGIHHISIIISHDDYDHSGALASLQEHFDVERVINQKQSSITLYGLAIDMPLYDCAYDDANDNSLICRFNLGDYRFLYLGDISSAVERRLVQQYNELKADVCKLSHHGSSTASSETLLSSIQPSIALISAGVNNRYGHPAESVIERLDAFKIKTYNTQTDHALRFVITRWMMIIQTGAKGWAFY